MTKRTLLGLALWAPVVLACAERARDQQAADTPGVTATPSTTPRVTILEPADDTVVAAGDSVRVVLGVEHLTLAPAGTEQPGTGHHHLLINRSLADEHAPIPVDSGIVHLGQAQTHYVLTGLDPGAYTVIAVLGDYLHVPIAGQVRDTVRFTVR